MKGLVHRLRHGLFWTLPKVQPFWLRAGAGWDFCLSQDQGLGRPKNDFRKTLPGSNRAPLGQLVLSCTPTLPGSSCVPPTELLSHSLCLSVPIWRSRQRFDQCCMNSCLSLQLYLACHRCWWPWLLLLATSYSVPHAFFSSVGSEYGHPPGCPLGSWGLFGATWVVQNNRFERHCAVLCWHRTMDFIRTSLHTYIIVLCSSLVFSLLPLPLSLAPSIPP